MINRHLFFRMVSLLVLCLVISCGMGPKQGMKRAPSKIKAGPERQASDALIEKGRSYLEQGLFDRAADTFQEALNLDPKNGAGFYYLAMAKYRSGEYGAVWGFLEKAESLLGKDPGWAEKISSFKKEINQSQGE